MWHRAGGIGQDCRFHFCRLLIQAIFRTAPFEKMVVMTVLIMQFTCGRGDRIHYMQALIKL